MAQDEGVRNLLKLAGILQADGPDAAPGSPQQGPTALNMAVDFEPLQVLTAQQVQQLAAFITGGSKGASGLPWPEPHTQLTAKQRLALSTHAQLYGFGDSVQGMPGGGLGQDAAAAVTAGAVAAVSQRPTLKGWHAHKVRGGGRMLAPGASREQAGGSHLPALHEQNMKIIS